MSFCRDRFGRLALCVLLVAPGCHHRREGGAGGKPSDGVELDAAAPVGRRVGGDDPWTNPFGIFYVGKQAAAFADAGVTVRVMAHQEQWESSEGPAKYDQAVTEGRQVKGVIVTLMPQSKSRQRKGVESIGYHKYCLPEGAELERSLRFIRRAVERYDGDADFGCTLGAAGPDCYRKGDGKYPKAPEALRARPIEIWQVENEPFFQLVDCAADDEPASGPKIAGYLEAGAGAVRAANPSATLVFPAVAGAQPLLMDRGLIDALHVGPSDCTHRGFTRADVEADPTRLAKEREAVRRARERVEYVLTHGTASYDAIDFHTYSNDVYEARAMRRWFDALGLADRAVVSTEMAGPYYMFVELGAPQPKDCASGGRDDRGPTRYDDALLSSFIVKKYVVGLAAGVKRMHWATGEELFDPYLDNYQRLALVEKGSGRRKPAYFTYRLLVGKLTGFIGPVEQHAGDVYAFQFPGEGPVVVAWTNGPARSVDLSGVIDSSRAKLTRLVVALDAAGAPIAPSVESLAANAVPLAAEPVFVEAER